MASGYNDIKSEISTESLFQQLRHFDRVYWIANWMEMFERLAYYGLRTVLPVYMVLSIEEGGPQFNHIQKGIIYAWWAVVQSGLPVFTGGYADRYGYKLTVGVAIAIKCLGYLGMAFAVEIASVLTGGASEGVPGHGVTYGAFMVGALLLAAGTAIFKPGLQGIIAVNMPDSRASLGWSVFYQLVNIGGFMGPFLAGIMRLMAWKWVFVSCAVIVCLNYLLLLTFEEPRKKGVSQKEGFWRVLWNSSIGILEPRLFSFLVIFSGFWMMFHQLFDLLPNFIDDWVDSRMVVSSLVQPLLGFFGAEVPEQWGGHLPQEFMINLNPGVCMLLAFYVGYLTGKVRSMTAMVGGITVSGAAIYGLGLSFNGWWTLACIAIFSIGELMASPTKMRYFSSIAPPGKKGLYMGYINATNGIGWALGSSVAGKMYEAGGDKVVLARRYLTEELGLNPGEVAEMAKTSVLPKLAELTAQSQDQVRLMLWNTYDPQHIWARFATIGVISMAGLLVFDRITRRNLNQEPWLLMALTFAVSSLCYTWIHGLVFTGLMLIHLAVERFAPRRAN